MQAVTRDDLHTVLQAPVGEGHYVSLFLTLTAESRSKRAGTIFLKKRVQQLEKLLGEHQGQLEEFEANMKVVEQYLGSELEDQAQGIAVFSNRAVDYMQVYQLSVPVRNRLVWDQGPHIEPLAEVVEDHHHHCVVLFDSHHGRILSLYLDQVQSESVYAEEVPTKVKAGGWSQMRYQRHHDERSHHFLKDLADSLDSFVRQESPDDVILLGQERHVAEFRKLLSQPVMERLAFTEHIDTDASVENVLQRIKPLIAEEREREEQELVVKLLTRIKQDYLAVGGIEATVAALLEGRVSKLLINPENRTRGLRCNSCAYLFSKGAEDPCCYCKGELREVNLMESMVEAAEKHDVRVRFFHQQNTRFNDRMDGVGAFLRY